MDGTLINTEDLYTEAISIVLARYGYPELTWDIKLDIQGRPGPEATCRLLAHYKLEVHPEEFARQTDEVQSGLWGKAHFLEGAQELIQYLKKKDIPIALGTSSAKHKYVLKTLHLRDTFDLFEGHIVTGDDPRIPPGKGKPAPYIWFVCLESINKERAAKNLEPISIEECLIFEDGIPGVVSAQTSGAHVIWVPHPEALVALNGREREILPEKGELLVSLKDFDMKRYGL